MKRVLILNGTSFVGGHVARAFYESHEYDVEVTSGAQDEDLLWRQVRTSELASIAAQEEQESIADHVEHNANNKSGDGGGLTKAERGLAQLPPTLRRYVTAVVPRHNDDPDEFRRRLLNNDVIVAVLEDDTYEAECALRILRGTYFDVEKTFVLVSSTLTWAHTILSERAKLRAQRRRERAEERAAYRRDYGEDEELPEHLQSDNEGDTGEDASELDGEGGVPMRTFTEAEYHARVPHPRYTPWLKLERLVKRANSATLHTYVVFAGVPYGCGEGPVLHPLLRAAWHAQELTLYGPGHNVIPMIHIRDLARIVYKLGDAYDVLEERYFFAVDRGNVTQLQLLQAVERALGGHIVPAAAPLVGHNVNVQENSTRGPLSLIERLERDFGNEPKVGIAHFVSDIRATPEAVFAVHPEEEWHALDGFVASMTKVCYEFRTTRQVTPVRIWLTGPPCSGASSVAARLAVRYGVPHLTRESVIGEYEAHVKSIRATLYELLLRRLLRRRTRRYERARQALEAERARLRAEAEMNDEMNDEEENDDDGNKNTQQEGEGEDEGAEGGEDDNNDEDDEEDNPQRAVSAALSELIDTACDVASAKAKITEAYLRGPPLLDAQGKPMIEGIGDNGAEEDEEFNADEEMPEEGEDEDEDDDNDEELTRAERRVRAARAAQDLQERIHIRELRLEYRLAQRALSMKLIDGRLPRPPKPHNDDEEEEEEEESNGVGNKGRASRRNEYDDEQEEGDEEEQEEEKDEAEGPQDEEDNEEEEEEEESEVGDAQEGKGQKGKHNDVDGPTNPGNILYLDEAVAFFMRWRLRQHDCRNQGYVLESYPETVRQARLLFQRSPNSTGDENDDDGEGESEEEHKRALPATTVEDVLAPLDADFAFPALHTMDEAKLRKLERAILQRNPVYQHLIESTTADPADALIAGMTNTTKEKGEHDAEKDNDDADEDEDDEGDEKDILAAVDEGLFPDYVLILQRTDRQLETIAGQRSTTAYYYHHAQSLLVQPQYSGSSHTISHHHQYTDRSSYTNSGEAAIRRHSSQQTDMSHTMPTRRTSSNAAEVSDVRPIPLTQPKREKRSGKEEEGEGLNEEVNNTLPQLQAYRRNSSVATAPDPLIDTVTPDRGFSADVTNYQNNNNNATAGLNETGKWANTATTMQEEEEKDDLRAMRPVKDVMAFYTALDYYRAHHGCGAIAPTISLVTWFQSVQTTEQRGATPTPVLPRFDPSNDAMGDEVMDRTTMTQGMEESNAGNAEEVNATRWAPSSTARTARVLTLQLPPPYITPALQAAFEAGTSCVSGTVTPFHTSPATSPVTRTETTPTAVMPNKTPLAPANEADAVVRTSEEILEDFADRLCSAETDLLPVPHVYGPMSAQLFDSSSPAERARLRREKALIQELLSKEAVMRSEAEQQMQAKLQEERRVLRGMQVRHGCLDVTQAHKMPMEQYLMEYVLPSLTPVLAEVVKVRPEDPVTTLADLLYQHKRRLSL